jgi:peptide/nickel transport system substrate-binding protein
VATTTPGSEPSYWSARTLGRLSRRRALSLAAGAGGVGLLAACGKSGGANSGSTKGKSAPSAAQPKAGGNVNVWQPVDPFDFDVTYLGKNTNNVEGIQHAYSTLIRFKFGPGTDYNTLTLEPALADRWETPDDQTYTFHMRPGVKFANLPPVGGRELTSADVKWSYEYESRSGTFADKKLAAAQNAWMFSGMSSIQTPDPQTVVVKFDQPYTPFLNYMAYPWNPIMPHEIFDADGHFKNRIVGTGPFQLDQAASQKGTRWVWKKNPTYWEPGHPLLDSVTWLVVADDAGGRAAFQTRQLDIYPGAGTNVDVPTLNQLKQQRPDATIDTYINPAPVHLYIQTTHPPLNDLRVRQAISLSLDRPEWIQTFTSGKGGYAMAGGFTDTFSQDEMKQMLKTDQAQAKQLLSAAGFANGLDLEILTPGQAYGDVYVQQAQLLQAQLKSGGFNTKITSIDKADYLSRKQKQNFQLVFTGKALAPDVDSYLTVFEPGAVENYGGITDATLTNLIHQQRQEKDPAKRRDLVREAAKRINVEQVWALALLYPVGGELWQGRLQGYAPNFGRRDWPLEHAWLSA